MDIDALIDLCQTAQNEDTRREAAWSLGEIGQGNPQAIDALINLCHTAQYEYTRIHSSVKIVHVQSSF